MAKVSIIMGSESDLETVSEAVNLLKEFKADFEVRVLSAHRTPKEVVKYVESASKKDTKVFIAAAGMSAALAGVVAAHTILPVIGVPIEGKDLRGLDSLLSTVQMPPGIPVGCMAIGRAGAKNAAIFALEILALNDPRIGARLLDYKKQMCLKIKKAKIKV
ncbi:MAG: 5-(carboxyamino)imidazole ribonucleotide mutase [Candidatus Omnitrophica bacterium]|nr:5-(carboxyamino)imidazole ribonucleotide mutase [Candidatus Omnitrophota bacterium]